MSTIIFLTNEDFSVQKINNANYLCSNIKGISVVMFYSTRCGYCQDLIPTFKKLPRVIPNCQFAMVNIDLHKAPVELSKQTIDPIKYVPYIVFYANRRPIIKYSGPYQIDKISKFVSDVSKTLTVQNFFTQDQTQKSDASKTPEIPAYTIGQPAETSAHRRLDEVFICKDGVCYLDALGTA
jgi:thioredoxin-like negative regulator of GroEL